MTRWIAALLIWLAGPLAAQEFIQTDEALDNEAFYRLVACAAPPGG